MSEPRTIDRLYAWIVTEADGGHGIPAFASKAPDGEDMMMPMVSSNPAVTEALRATAMQMLGPGAPDGPILKLELVEFSGRRVLETHVNPELKS
jgi:hypothetical protein